MKKTLLLALGFGTLNFAMAQSGVLDPTFGVSGIAKTQIGASFNYNAAARQVLINPAGGSFILLEKAIVIKILANGSIDSTYGINGYAGSVNLIDCHAALQADGKIVIAGSKSNNSFNVTRITATGLLDAGFGVNGIQVTAIPGSSNPGAVAIQPDGKIVVAGTNNDGGTNFYFALARYNPDGSPDTGFSGDGQLTTDFKFFGPPDRGGEIPEIHYAFANAVAIQADGKIVAGGYAANGSEVLQFALARYQPNGRPDSSFDADGLQTNNDAAFGDNRGYSLALQTDGRIVMAGIVSNGTAYFGVARYNTDGSPDNSFSGDGLQTSGIECGTDVANSVAIQADGRIVVAGFSNTAGTNDFAIARFNTNGLPDNSFDGDGILLTDFTAGDDYAGSIAIQPDNNFLIAGYSYRSIGGNTIPQLAISRYKPNATLDSSFAENGKLTGNFSQGNTRYFASAIQSNGRTVTAGTAWNGTNYDFAVARYTSNGRLDSTFSTDGILMLDFGGNDEAHSVLIQTDGRIVVGGSAANQFAVARFNADGSPDNSFSGDGRQTISIGIDDNLESMALQADGKIVLVGISFSDPNYDSAYFGVARLNTNGTTDNSFSLDGKLLTNFEDGLSFGSSVAIQTNGKILVAGRTYFNGQDAFSVARYNADGTLDNSFSGDGKQTNVFGDDQYFAEAVKIQPDGKVLLGGYSETLSGASTSFALARYQANGTLDSSFGSLGYRATSLGNSFNFGVAMALNTDGRIALAGTNDRFAIVLYNANGNADSSFGQNGVVITNIGLPTSGIESIFFSSNRLYAAGSGEFPGQFGLVARYLLVEGGPLPVTLVDFTARLLHRTTLLQWHTTGEKSFAGFTVERSANGSGFYPISFVDANGNGNSRKTYSTIDRSPLNGVNYYRLKMVDKDGGFEYSKVVTVTLNEPGLTMCTFPNPAANTLFVRWNGDSERAVVQIMDVSGKLMRQENISLESKSAFGINIHNLPKGVYIVQVLTQGTTETRKFIKE
jgi:uncharacterized delta-60 repeat protein